MLLVDDYIIQKCIGKFSSTPIYDASSDLIIRFASSCTCGLIATAFRINSIAVSVSPDCAYILASKKATRVFFESLKAVSHRERARASKPL